MSNYLRTSFTRSNFVLSLSVCWCLTFTLFKLIAQTSRLSIPVHYRRLKTFTNFLGKYRLRLAAEADRWTIDESDAFSRETSNLIQLGLTFTTTSQLSNMCVWTVIIPFSFFFFFFVPTFLYGEGKEMESFS